MDSNFKKITKKRWVTLLILVSIVATTAYSPVFAPRAHAGFPVIDIKALAKTVADAVGMRLAQRMVDDMVKSSIAWANSGFEGGPAYVTDPGQYFGNIANRAAGGYINKIAGSNLCAPFKPQIVVSLAEYYSSNQGYDPIIDSQCTFTGITGNLEDFYNDFSAGGWEGWFSMTQHNANNPYALYLETQTGLDKDLEETLGIERAKIDWGRGFRSKGPCVKTNIPMPGAIGGILTDPSQPPGACLEYGPDTTPGSIIHEQLTKTLGTGVTKLLTVAHVEQLVGAFANGLLNRYVFGPKGLFTTDYGDHFSQPSDGPIIEADQATIDAEIEKVGGLTPWPTGDNDDNGDNGGGDAQLSCAPNVATAVVNSDIVTWSISSNLNPGTTYNWSGTELPTSTSLNVTIMYPTEGIKTASVTATIPTSNSSVSTMTAGCSGSVNVISGDEFNQE